MSKVRILGARLSSNPDTATVQNEQGINGLVNSTVNNKLFYVVDAMVLKGLAPVKKSQMVWADDNGKFPVSAEDYNKYMTGVEVGGKLVTFEGVPEYEVDGKKFTHVELLVMDGQAEATVVGNFLKRNTQTIAQPKPQSMATSGLSGAGKATPAAGKATPAAGKATPAAGATTPADKVVP